MLVLVFFGVYFVVVIFDIAVFSAFAFSRVSGLFIEYLEFGRKFSIFCRYAGIL